MKAILEFNLPEDQAEFDTAVRGGQLHAFAWAFQEWLRAVCKHGDLSEPEYDQAERTRDKWYQLLDHYGITIE